MNCSLLQELLHEVRATSALKSVMKWKMTDMIIEEHLLVSTVKVLVDKVRSMDTEITDNHDLSL